MSDPKTALCLETRAVHAGEPERGAGGALVQPIYQSSTYADDGGRDYHDLPYLRLNNSPNHLALHRKLADLEGAEDALVTSSGMAAISTALLTVLKSGDHVLAGQGLYGGTHTLFTRDLPALGINHDFVDLRDPESWRRKLRPDTRAFYVETLANPLLTLGNLPLVADFCAGHGLTSLVDNTLASPVNCNPLALGCDIVLHSATKYLNGHSDIVAGVIAGREETIAACKHKLDHLGATLDPHACFLLQRGIRTLVLRVERQNENALALANFLEGQAAVSRVNYPGLPSHPDHGRAGELLRGFGGLLSFEHVAGGDAAGRMARSLRIATMAVSLGGVETLVTLPARTSHAGLTGEERRRFGIADGLVRVAVGIEAVTDLQADFASALDAAEAA
jgi:cystathionine gamma-synthase/cystathionine gamma-lyase/cystathionine beta-lyase